MFSFIRKGVVVHGAIKALAEAGINPEGCRDCLALLKDLGFVKALDASRDALPQSIQSICLAFASLEVMTFRFQLLGQGSYVSAINDSKIYLAEALKFQISVSKDPEYTNRNVTILLESINKDTRNFIVERIKKMSL